MRVTHGSNNADNAFRWGDKRDQSAGRRDGVNRKWGEAREEGIIDEEPHSEVAIGRGRQAAL